jgi:heptosyltransferase-3
VKRIELLGKRIVRAILRLVLSSKAREPQDLRPDEVRRILVVRQDNRIGNLILQIPLIRAIKKAFPQASITVVLGQRFAELYRHLPEIDHRIVFRHREFARKPWRWVSFVRFLRRGGWDVAFECGHPHVVSLNNASLTYLSRAPFRVGFRRQDADIFLNILQDAPGQVHYAAMLKALIAPWERTSSTYPMSLPLPEEHQDAWRRLWERAGLEEGAKVVLIWSGGRYDKRWSVDFLESIAADVSRTTEGAWIPVMGVGPGELELGSAFGDAPGLKVVQFDGPVEELWSFMDRCQAVISGDTGPMHLAVALGLPTFAMFKIDDVWEYGHDDGQWHRAVLVTGTEPISELQDFLKALVNSPCPRSTMFY